MTGVAATPLGTAAVDRHDVRLVVVDRAGGSDAIRLDRFAALPAYLDAGDLVVVNDAATLPGSLTGRTGGAPIEVRLLPPVDGPRVDAVVFGAGDHTTPTEHRPPPPPLTAGAHLDLGPDLGARVMAVRGRRVVLELDRDGDRLWRALYRRGRPIQYAHRPERLPLWAAQTSFAARPWAAEMPSAGRPLTWEILLGLRRRGVAVASLTHAAGLSSTGDPELDRALPWPERYDIPAATAARVDATRAAGRRVIAVGTTVVRALEAAADDDGRIRSGAGVAELIVTPARGVRVVDGIVSGLHGPEESHFRLLGALVDRPTLDAALAAAAAAGLQGHELGDACLIGPALVAGRVRDAA